jgi:GH15 family glucan-1,4-alpha-glucosidase
LDYGIIGNCSTAALVKSDSSIDWMCMPKFDSPSIFAKILDNGKGGFFKVEPEGQFNVSQAYIADTNVLETRFVGEGWEFRLMDYFPHFQMEDGSLYKEPEVHRLIELVRGTPRIRIVIEPAFKYASEVPKAKIESDHIVFEGSIDYLYLYTNMPADSILGQGYFDLKGDSYMVLAYNKLKAEKEINAIKEQMDKTISYWRSWIGMARLPSVHRDLVARSALTLRLLTYDNTGAIVAAATTSIPEIIGEVRNWDYRYCWIRDASFTVMALINILRFDVAKEFLGWMLKLHKEYGINLQVLFGINGDRDIPERELDYLSGYKNSKPVRVGNAAAKQRQVDIFGELLDAIYLIYVKYKIEPKINDSDWELVYSLVESAIKEWHEKDHSIWEFRKLSRHYTFSKVLCWTAVDRGIKIAKEIGKTAEARRWSKVRSHIKADIIKNGWNAEVNAFVQCYGSRELDASILLLPYFGFTSFRSKKMKSTVEAIGRQLFNGEFLLRYAAKDDFGIPKNALIACTFWYIDALAGIGRRDDALDLLERIISHTNHLGLFSEDIDRSTYELLGNFPQAYSHIALINTMTNLFGSNKMAPKASTGMRESQN